jgi:hypothetical protein
MYAGRLLSAALALLWALLCHVLDYQANLCRHCMLPIYRIADASAAPYLGSVLLSVERDSSGAAGPRKTTQHTRTETPRTWETHTLAAHSHS